MICRSFPVCSTQMERKKAGMKCVIFAGLPAAPELHSWWADADYVIAADAGYENACRVGVEPDLLLGDYDSAPRPEAGAKTVFLPAEKDDTDTYYAARKALELGATDVVIVGGLGGARLDHTLANLQTLVFLAKNGVCATLADTDNDRPFAGHTPHPGAAGVVFLHFQRRGAGAWCYAGGAEISAARLYAHTCVPHRREQRVRRRNGNAPVFRGHDLSGALAKGAAARVTFCPCL